MIVQRLVGFENDNCDRDFDDEFKWRHVNLSGPGTDELLHLLIADLNSVLENGLHH